MYGFAALRFIEDENIADRVYWYLSEEEFAVGDLVLAPVGTHNRLQLARVERTYTGEEQDAPYDVRFLKRVESKYQSRRLAFGNAVCFELGGVRYDGKRYTRFRRALCTQSSPPFSVEVERALARYGVAQVFSAEEECAVKAFLSSSECVLFYGARATELCQKIVACVRGEDGLFDEETALGLRRRLR